MKHKQKMENEVKAAMKGQIKESKIVNVVCEVGKPAELMDASAQCLRSQSVDTQNNSQIIISKANEEQIRPWTPATVATVDEVPKSVETPAARVQPSPARRNIPISKSVSQICQQFSVYNAIQYKEDHSERLAQLALKAKLKKCVNFVRTMHLDKLEVHHFPVIPQDPYTSEYVKNFFELVK